MSKVYEIREEECEIPVKRGERLPDVVSAQEIADRYFALTDFESNVIERYDTLDEAREALKKFEKKASTYYYQNNGSRFFAVDIYYIEENEYDEDGDIISGGDVWECAASPVTVNY